MQGFSPNFSSYLVVLLSAISGNNTCILMLVVAASATSGSNTAGSTLHAIMKSRCSSTPKLWDLTPDPLNKSLLFSSESSLSLKLDRNKLWKSRLGEFHNYDGTADFSCMIPKRSNVNIFTPLEGSSFIFGSHQFNPLLKSVYSLRGGASKPTPFSNISTPSNGGSSSNFPKLTNGYDDFEDSMGFTSSEDEFDDVDEKSLSPEELLDSIFDRNELLDPPKLSTSSKNAYFRKNNDGFSYSSPMPEEAAGHSYEVGDKEEEIDTDRNTHHPLQSHSLLEESSDKLKSSIMQKSSFRDKDEDIIDLDGDDEALLAAEGLRDEGCGDRRAEVNEDEDKRHWEHQKRHESSSTALGNTIIDASVGSPRKYCKDEEHDVLDSSLKRRFVEMDQSLQTIKVKTNNMQNGRAAPTSFALGYSPKVTPRKLAPSKPLNSTSINSTAKAVWGPHAHYRKTPPAPPPKGPPPTKATDDERRAHETKKKLWDERRKMLSSWAIYLHDSHTSALQALIRGNAAHIPPELFGQTIMQEKSACNESFYGRMTEVGVGAAKSDTEFENTVLGEEIAQPSPSFRHIEDPSLLSYWGLAPTAKLYGGAQYHRTVRYYHHLFLTVPLPPITDDEIALLSNGITEVHDASDLMRSVALLARHKMELVMEDILADMTRRLLYVLDRQWYMVEYSNTLHRPLGKPGSKSEADLLGHHGDNYSSDVTGLKQILSDGFHKFAEEKATFAHDKSLEDIRSLLKYITWDMGRSQKLFKSQRQNDQGSHSQIKIVSEPVAGYQTQNNGRDKRSREKSARKNEHVRSFLGSSERILARGGAVSNWHKQSKAGESKRNNGSGLSRKEGALDDESEDFEDMGDLIGGVLNRGVLFPDESFISQNNGTKYSHGERGNPNAFSALTISSRSSPMFPARDEVLSVLLETLSSSLIPKSEAQASHTATAIESLVNYVTDRMRMDISQMIRGKFNTLFLLSFYEDLGPFLRRELDTYLASLDIYDKTNLS